MRVKFIKNHNGNRKDDVLEVSRNEAFGLVDSGVAIISKDMTEYDPVYRYKEFSKRKKDKKDK